MNKGTIQRDKIYVYDTCAVCSEQNVLVYECGDSLMCAEHARVWMRQNPRKQLCDKCGTDELVFRDPGHRRNEYLCFSCHRENEFVPRNTVVFRAIKKILGREDA
jgi:hypothetical protein